MGKRSRQTLQEPIAGIPHEILFGSPNSEWKEKLRSWLTQLNLNSKHNFDSMKAKRINGEIPLNCFPSVCTSNLHNYKFIIVQHSEPVNEWLKIMHQLTEQFLLNLTNDLLNMDNIAPVLYLGVVADGYSVIKNMIATITGMFSEEQASLASGIMLKTYLEKVIRSGRVKCAKKELQSTTPIDIAVRKHLDNITDEIQDHVKEITNSISTCYNTFDQIANFFKAKILEVNFNWKKHKVRTETSVPSENIDPLHDKSVDELVDYINGSTESTRRNRRKNRKEAEEDAAIDQFRKRLESVPLQNPRLKPNITKDWLDSLTRLRAN